MFLIHVFSDYDIYTILALASLAFIAGFIDAVVGGGGLIQLPALLIHFPNSTLPTILGTNKIAALSGTSIAAFQYSRKIKFNYKLLIIVSASAFISSFIGAKVVSNINTHVLKPYVLVILIFIAIYTYFKKDLGTFQSKTLSFKKQAVYSSILGIVIGFYDGFLGPGTGSFLVLGFVVLLGFEFVVASAYSKVINSLTNISALIVFIKQKDYLLEIAVLMAVCNIIGSIIGSHMAIKRGNHFVRVMFLIIVTFMIVRYGYDILFGLK